jgi:hypothetical protein
VFWLCASGVCTCNTMCARCNTMGCGAVDLVVFCRLRAIPNVVEHLEQRELDVVRCALPREPVPTPCSSVRTRARARAHVCVSVYVRLGVCACARVSVGAWQPCARASACAWGVCVAPIDSVPAFFGEAWARAALGAIVITRSSHRWTPCTGSPMWILAFVLSRTCIR